MRKRGISYPPPPRCLIDAMEITELIYTQGTPADTDDVMALIKDAGKAMEAQGIFQWNDAYPAIGDIQHDIAGKTLTTARTPSGMLAAVYVFNHECHDAYHDYEWAVPEEQSTLLHRFAVSPALQNMGLGSRVLQHIEAHAAEAGYGAIRLDVFTKNPAALHLYDKNGYVRRGTGIWPTGKFLLMEKVLGPENRP